MSSSYLIRLGAPGLLLGLVAVGCTPGGRPASLSSVAPKADKQAARRAADAESAIKTRQVAQAVAAAEEAVALSPRNAAYRTALGQAYLLAGRFGSAETSFTEALALDPAPGRASFNLALTQIALGKADVARESLARLNGVMPDADVGLATALSGDREGGIVILERAARAENAGVKARQNLALAYALAGRWNDAQAVAAQDLPGDELLLRISDWAKFAQPTSSWDQVATILGVTPSVDPGRPVALALVDSAPAAFAAAEAAPVTPPVEGTGEEPVQVASADLPVLAVPEGSFVAPRQASTPQPMLLTDESPTRIAVSAHAPARAPAIRPRSGGKWVVQLGAFSRPHAVEAAWSRIAARLGGMDGYAPGRSMLLVDGSARLHRLAMSGFATRDEAQRMCVRIRSGGGDCFVRSSAGEQPIRWAARGNALLAMR